MLERTHVHVATYPEMAKNVVDAINVSFYLSLQFHRNTITDPYDGIEFSKSTTHELKHFLAPAERY